MVQGAGRRGVAGGESPEGWMEVGRVKGCGGWGSCLRRWCKWMWGVAEGGKPKPWIIIEGSCQTCFTKRKHSSRMLSVLVSRFLEQYKKWRQNVTDYRLHRCLNVDVSGAVRLWNPCASDSSGHIYVRTSVCSMWNMVQWENAVWVVKCTWTQVVNVVSDHLERVLWFLYVFWEPSCIEEASRSEDDRRQCISSVVFLHQVLERDRVGRVLVRCNACYNPTPT